MPKAEHLSADDRRLQFPRFNEFQGKFILCKYPFLCGGGGYGSGKTTALILRAILMGIDSEWFGDMTGNEGILGRYKMLDFQKTTLREFFRWLPRDWIRQYWHKDGKLELKNGTLYHLTHLDGIEHLQSYNLGFAGIDQMEQVDEQVFDCLALDRIRRKSFTRYRRDGSIIAPQFDPITGDCVSTDPDEVAAVLNYHTVFGVCNPRPCWIQTKFVENEELQHSTDSIVFNKYSPEFKYLHIATRENLSNLPDNYIDRQRDQKSTRQFLRDVEGSWDTWEGKVYIGCNKGTLETDNVIPHPAWDIYIGIDHGGTGEDSSMATGITAVVFAGYEYQRGQYPKIHIFDELYLQSSTIDNTVSEIDTKLKLINLAQRELYGDEAKTPDNRPRVRAWRGDPSMWRKLPETYDTVAAKYGQYARSRGFIMSLYPGDNDVTKMVGMVDWMMRRNILKISPRCHNTYTEHMSLQYGNNEKIRAKQRDHATDATRYLVSAMPLHPNEVSIPQRDRTLVERELDKLVTEQNRDNIYGRSYNIASM